MDSAFDIALSRGTRARGPLARGRNARVWVGVVVHLFVDSDVAGRHVGVGVRFL